MAGAAVAIAIEMPGEKPEWEAYDEGRVAERILVAAGALDLGAGIGWAVEEERPAVAGLLGLTAPPLRPDDHLDRPPDNPGAPATLGARDGTASPGRGRPGALKRPARTFIG